ncbi:unnamed protein product [Pylaiella littoralis]
MMGRKRRRPIAEVANVAAAAAAPPPPPPYASPRYFCYTPAQEKKRIKSGGSADNIDNSRYLKSILRGRHQQEVDKVDIPAPTEWLCHDAAASARLHAQAQTDLQLFLPRRPSHQPHSERQELHVRNRDAGLVAAIKSTVGNKNYFHGTKREMRPGRVVCGGEVLPWGTWPARLRHHDGQSFYQENEDMGNVDGSGDGVRGAAPNYVVGGGDVGRSGGVGIVSEDHVHDALLRRQLLPSSSSSSSSLLPSAHQYHGETAVTRLVPDKRGRWAEATTRRVPLTAAATAAAAAAAAAVLPGENLATAAAPSDSISSRPSSPPTATPVAASTTAPAGGAVKCVIPGRYGGWVEFKETASERAQNNAWQRRKRRAAVSMAARFGPDSGGGGGDASMTGVVPDAALPSSYLDEEKYARRMVAEAAAAAAVAATEAKTETSAREAQRQRPEELAQHHQGAHVGIVLEEGDKDGGGDGQGGGLGGVAMAGTEGMRTKRGCNTVAVAGSAGKRRADDGEAVVDRHDVCRRHGWTISEPAKETVRRVWNRARRRARDSFEPRHGAPRAGDDLTNKASAAAAAAPAAGTAAAAADCGSIRDKLDPGLLHCLGRECEGIIDAALHVVLGDRLRAVQTSSVPVLSSTEQEKKNLSPRPPPPLATADWQDVLRAMQNCSERARGVRTPAAAVATGTAKSDGDRRHPPSGAAAAHGGRQEGKRSEGGAVEGRTGEGREGVPGRGVMERAVWGAGNSSDGSVVVVNERLPGLPLNEAVLTRAYNRLLLYLHEKKSWHA